MSEATVRIPAVYAITHRPTGRTYVGASIDVATRFRGHLSQFKRRLHSKVLQADWERDGEEAFRFELLQTGLSVWELVEREQHWIDTLPNVYNTRRPHVVAWARHGLRDGIGEMLAPVEDEA